MKKIFNLILAALVIIGAAACTKSDEIVDQTQQGEGLSFYAEIVNGNTRAYIDDSNEDKVWNTIWEKEDKVSVTCSSETYTFIYGDGKFTCTDDGVTSLIGKTVTIEPVANLNSKAGNKGWSFTSVEVADFGANVKVQLEANTSFFRYTYNGDKAITFTADKQVFVVNSESTNTVTFAAGEVITAENFVAFWTNNGGNALEAKLSCSIGGIECKNKTLTLMPGKIYNLGTLTDPVASKYGVVGSFQGWDVAVGKPVTMYEAKDGWCVARGIELYKDDEFKIVKGNSWDVSYGPSAAAVLEVGVEHSVVSKDGQNVKVAKNGKFDIYLNPTTNKLKYECVEEYTDLTVNITIENKANWSPLSIILKSGQTLLTKAEGDPVSGNTYAVSGDYIGSSLSYQFVSGSKKTDFANVTITKTGATVLLEETIIKLTVKLDTANAKQWWGNTMKIHVWDTGTSFDTSWPGTEMTSEGDKSYAWSINVPSELVGKKIKYLVHNGNGWQSNDATVTIKKEGNTITGSSIGIN